MEKDIFAVGLPLSIQAHYKTYLTTTVLGWEKDTFIMTRAIFIEGKPAKLNNKDICKIRFLRDGVAYGCEAEIITTQFFPFPMMFLKYPTKVECLKLRVADRYKVDRPVILENETGEMRIESIMLDVSEGGGGVKVPNQEGVELTPEQNYFLTFKLMYKEIRILCSVKKLDKRPEFTFLGLEFTNLPDDLKEEVELFIIFLKKHGAR